MARNRTKKTNQDPPWNRRKAQTKVYALDSRSANTKRFFIICEGKNTEPAYFKSFPVFTAEVDSYGIGRSKLSLVEHVIEKVKQEKPDKEREIWIVFDMDYNSLKEAALQRNDYNQAIQLAERHGFKVAYSNDSFELWLILHYELLEAVLTRIEYCQRISTH